MNQKSYLELSNDLPIRSVSLGYKKVTLFNKSELTKAQTGYSIGPSGQTLVGSETGDWKDTWLVIADEDESGDPIFIDLASEDWPVYTAIHGEGSWEPERIADSFRGFVQSLEQMKSLSKGRENPAKLEKKPVTQTPVTQTEANAALQRLRQINPNSSVNFWARWLEE